ncbi:MAG: cyclic nucleotide-binding domain-containing protein [Bacteroidota bacterium]|nr:cyclic nucleotide-binding domain-containing protein [Bacteroidota bacterium]
MDELVHFIKSKINIDDRDLECILSYFKKISFKRDAYVLREHHYSTNYYFVKPGGVRIWFDKGGEQVTAWLIFENDFFAELSGLKSDNPTQFNIQAITDTTLLAIDKNSMGICSKNFRNGNASADSFGKMLF